MADRSQNAVLSRTLYDERNHFERFFGRIEHFRRIAPRCEKRVSNYLAVLKLAAAHL